MSELLTKQEWLRKKRQKKVILFIIAFVIMIVVVTLSAIFVRRIVEDFFGISNKREAITYTLSNGTVITRNYLTPNEYSRPQDKLRRVKGVVIHYTGNPGTSAKGNRDYFEGLARSKKTYASSHYIIGLEGEIIQCIPLNEIAYASKQRNVDTISIEVCHEDTTGKFNEKSYNSLVALTAALCYEYGLEEKDIMRHYDVTEKLCPLYYVEHEDEWIVLQKDVMLEMIRMRLMSINENEVE